MKSEITPEVVKLFGELYVEATKKARRKQGVILSHAQRAAIPPPGPRKWREKLFWINSCPVQKFDLHLRHGKHNQ